MKKIIFFLTVIMLFSACSKDKKKTNWNYFYDSLKKDPYGLYVFRKEMEENVFPESDIYNIKGSTYHFFDTLSTTYYTSFVYINRFDFFSDELFQKLENYGRENDVFISTERFDHVFSDSSYVVTKKINAIDNKKIDVVNFVLVFDSFTQNYTIKHRAEDIFYFDSIPKDAITLGYIEYNGKQYANLIRVHTADSHYGIILHANPVFFTNYYMLKDNDYQYAVGVMSLLKQTGTIYWDGQRTEKRYMDEMLNEGQNNSVLSFFLSKPELKWAFYLFFATFVGYFIFNYKRIQRAITIKSIPENNTVSYIKTVATLFMKEKNMAAITKYKINYLLDKIRRVYLLHIEEINDDFIKKLSEKSEVPFSETESTFILLKDVKNATYVSKKDFYKLNNLIENFINKSKLYDRK